MRRQTACIASALALVVFCTPALGSNARRGLERAAADFQQAAYELGIQLAMGNTAGARAAMRQTWNQLTRLRNIACSANLRSHVNGIAQNPRIAPTTLNNLDAIAAELDTLAKTLDVSLAQKELASAREAYEKRDSLRLREDVLAILDAVTGAASGLPLVHWVDGLREARQILERGRGPEEAAKALAVLRDLEGVDAFRERAYREALAAASESIAAASDLFLESMLQDGAEMIRRAEMPLVLAGRVSRDPAIQARTNAIRQQIENASRMLTVEFNWANTSRIEGFRMLQGAQLQIAQLASNPLRSSAPDGSRSSGTNSTGADASPRD